MTENKKRILYVVNVDWFFLSHRKLIAEKASEEGFEIAIATILTDRRTELEELGLEVYKLEAERGKISILEAFSLVFQLLKIYTLFKPDIVHLISIKPVLFGGLASRLANVPAMVAAVSGLGSAFLSTGPKAKVIRCFVIFLYRISLMHKNSLTIFQNLDDQELISKAANLPDYKSTLIKGSGVDLEKFPFQPIPDGEPVVMLPARLLSNKGVWEFVEAARIVQNACKEKVRFVLVGDVDPSNSASLNHDELQKIKTENYVEVWGHSDDMSLTLGRSTIVVLPSYREGLPKVLLEAAASGRPVITTDVPGCREAVKVGETGLLVESKDSESLAAALIILLNDPNRCLQMGKAGRLYAEQFFDVNEVANKHIEIYSKLLCHLQ